MKPFRILIVEDDGAFLEGLTYNMRRAGFEVISALDGRQGLRMAQTESPDLVILDVMLPVIDGLEVCRQLRANAATKRLPIVMLTAKSEDNDQIAGFSAGADDYVPKLSSVFLLIERIKALLRREERLETPDELETTQVVECHGIRVDTVRHRVTLDGASMDLTPSEFGLLYSLVRRPGRAFTRNELIDAALGQDVVVLERTIDVHIRALRKKLGAKAVVIETVRGVGYRFRDPSDPITDAELRSAAEEEHAEAN